MLHGDAVTRWIDYDRIEDKNVRRLGHILRSLLYTTQAQERQISRVSLSFCGLYGALTGW